MLKQNWDLTPLYRSDDDPKIEADLRIVSKQIDRFAKKWVNRQDYLTDAGILGEALAELEVIEEKFGLSGKPGYYFSLRSAQDQNSPEIRALTTKIDDIGIENANKIRFFRLNLGQISVEQQERFLADERLKPYFYYLKTLFTQAKFSLSEKEENVLSLLESSAYDKWVNMLSGLIAKEERLVLTEAGQKEPKNFSELNGLITSQNKPVRDDAARAINDIVNTYADVAENEINAVLETKKVTDKLRGYARPDQDRHLADDIDSAVVDVLVKTVSENFDIAKRYYQLKAKLLGVKKLAYHERSVEIGELGGNYSYEQAVGLVSRSLNKLDPEFDRIFREFTDGQIDVFPSKNKAGGAFCTHNLKTLPTYILLNHVNKIRDVTTLAHEVGHGLNNELVRAKQRAFYFGTPLSTAEVASTFVEDFALIEILAEADYERRLAIMVMKLNDDIATIHRQVAGYQFEQELHQEYRRQGYLSKQTIGQIFQKHMNAYMGPAVDQSPGSENWWIFWRHFRRPFYVYSYASGLLISKSLQASVKKDPAFIGKVKDFLAAGLSDSPKNIFAKLGVDIESKAFWQNGLSEVETLLTETEKLAQKLGKI